MSNLLKIELPANIVHYCPTCGTALKIQIKIDPIFITAIFYNSDIEYVTSKIEGIEPCEKCGYQAEVK